MHTAPSRRAPRRRRTPAPASASPSRRRPRRRAAPVDGRRAAGRRPDPGSPFAELDGGHSLVLVDANGLRLAGSLPAPDGAETGDRVAAQLAGVSREAARATRLLGLGTWQAITVESPDAHFVLVPPDRRDRAARGAGAFAPDGARRRWWRSARRARRKSWLERVQ